MADIVVRDITNEQGTGIFDKLMAAVNTHINDQYQNNRITGSDYANVYLGSIQGVLQSAVQYTLTEQMTEAQIDGITADNLLKAKQLEIAEQELLIKQEELALKTAEANRLRDMTEAELEKQWGYEVTRNAEGELVLGNSLGTGKIDQEGKLLYIERILKDKQTAKLGLDNVMKAAELEKASNPNLIYTPKYESI